jgi:hypothetical protein
VASAVPLSDLQTTPMSEKVLLGLTNNTLDTVFRDSPAGPIPDGNMRGTVLAWPGTRLAKLLAELIYLIAWQGKVVDRRESLLRNKITPVRLRVIKAKLSHEDSWVDQRECVLLDYSKTSWVTRLVRDELRLVGPELYLGVVWLWRWRVGWFTLRSPGVEAASGWPAGMAEQVAVTVRAEIADGQAAAVTEILSTQGAGAPADDLRLARLPRVHFARMFVLETVTLQSGKTVPASLVYMADVDGPVDRHLRALVENAASGVDKLFGSCVGYPARPDNAQRTAWLRGHTLKAAAYYVHTVGRTVERIKDETRLYDCVQDILDRGEVPVSAAAPTQLRQQLRDAVLRRADFLWIKEGPRGAGLVRELRDSVELVGGLALLLAAAPVLVPVGLLWLLLVRAVERTDSQEEGVPDHKHVDEVRRYEDFGAQNPFTGVGEIKPGLVRLVTMRVALAGLGLACRHAYNRDTLAGIDSIHFARWVLLDDDRRLIFASSYDGSLESYMDDFISRVAWGINLVFGNGAGFPRTRWLIFGGARDEIRYKHYLRRHQVPTRVFFSAYPRRTASNLDRFTKVRAGIVSDNAADVDEWLALL